MKKIVSALLLMVCFSCSEKKTEDPTNVNKPISIEADTQGTSLPLSNEPIEKYDLSTTQLCDCIKNAKNENEALACVPGKSIDDIRRISMNCFEDEDPFN